MKKDQFDKLVLRHFTTSRLDSKKTKTLGTKPGYLKNLSNSQIKRLEKTLNEMKNNKKKQKFKETFTRGRVRNNMGTVEPERLRKQNNSQIKIMTQTNLNNIFYKEFFKSHKENIKSLRDKLTFLNDSSSEYLLLDVEKAESILVNLETIYKDLLHYSKLNSKNIKTSLPPKYELEFRKTNSAIYRPDMFIKRKIELMKKQYENLFNIVHKTLQTVNGKTKDGVTKAVIRMRQQLNSNHPTHELAEHILKSVLTTLNGFTHPNGYQKFVALKFTVPTGPTLILTKLQYQLLMNALIQEGLISTQSFDRFTYEFRDFNNNRNKQHRLRIICSAFEIAYIGLQIETTLPVAPFRTCSSCGAGNHCPSLQSVKEFTIHANILAIKKVNSLFMKLLETVFVRFRESTGLNLRHTKFDFFIPRRYVVPLKYVDGITSNLYASTEHGFAHHTRVRKHVNKRAGVPMEELDTYEKLMSYVNGNIQAARDSVILQGYMSYLRQNGISLYDITDFGSVNSTPINIKYGERIKIDTVTKENALEYENGYPWMVVVLQLTDRQKVSHFSGMDNFIRGNAFDITNYALYKNGVTNYRDSKLLSVQLTPINMHMIYNAYINLPF